MSRIISTEGAESCERWRKPDVGAGEERGGARSGSLTTASRVEEIHQQAYQEGFELGKREGLEHGRAQLQAQVQHVESIAAFLSRPLGELDEQLVEEISELAVIIAGHIIRREIKADPGQVVAVVQQALGVLPVASRHIRVHVHPADAAVLREHWAASADGSETWQIVEDASLSRGGCHVETETSRVDASVERRLAAISAQVLGGEREGDSDHG